MGAKNKVIAGDYEGKKVTQTFGMVSLSNFTGSVELSKYTVESYEIVDESHRKSAVSAIGRGLAGSLLLGPVDSFFASIKLASSIKKTTTGLQIVVFC